jgi:hypothetical protein
MSDRLVLVNEELLMELVELANPEEVITVEWGEPVTEEVAYYNPVFTKHTES